MLNDSEKHREARGKRNPRDTKDYVKQVLGFRRDRLRYGGEAVKVAPIPVIEDDYRAIKKEPKRKMSELSLRYMKDRKLINCDQYTTYRAAHTLPHERTIITEHNIINDVNSKLIELFETV